MFMFSEVIPNLCVSATREQAREGAYNRQSYLQFSSGTISHLTFSWLKQVTNYSILFYLYMEFKIINLSIWKININAI